MIAFFEYAGHCSYYSSFHKNGKYSRDKRIVFIDMLTRIMDDNLDATIEKLEALKTE